MPFRHRFPFPARSVHQQVAHLCMCGVLCVMVAAIYTPFLQTAFDTTPLSLGDWGVVFGVASTVLIGVEIAKAVMRLRSRERA
ncbi:MAG: hypothetical protein FJZ95_01660 [Chloroflexi bacterium]|nr:hypothetical protein [Chloroflexota bacterium]